MLGPCWQLPHIIPAGSAAAKKSKPPDCGLACKKPSPPLPWLLPTTLTPWTTPACTGSPRMPQLPTYALLSLRSGLCTCSPSVLNSFSHFLLLTNLSAFWSHKTAPPPGSLPASCSGLSWLPAPSCPTSGNRPVLVGLSH